MYSSVALHFRPYNQRRDEAAVIDLFRSNVDPYFLPAEEEELRAFLAEPWPYFVAESLTNPSGQLLAAGGYALNNNYAVLTWGMVDRHCHSQGIGRAFTQFRLAECRRAYPGRGVELHTSQHTTGFYAKLGFRILAVLPDKWGLGLDEVHMLLEADQPVIN